MGTGKATTTKAIDEDNTFDSINKEVNQYLGTYDSQKKIEKPKGAQYKPFEF